MELTSSEKVPAQRATSLAGKIMWLPPKQGIPTNLLEPALEHGAYDHPVIIMSNNTSPEGLVEVFLMTSFGGRSIEETQSPRWKHWLSYVPIEPAVHPDLAGSQLSLVDGCQLEKASYVNTRQAHMVHLAALRPHRSTSVSPVLDHASLKKLRGLTSFVDLFNPRTSKKLRDYKVWEMDDKWRKGKAQAQPLPQGTVVTNPYFPAFSWLAHTPIVPAPSSPPTYYPPTHIPPAYNRPTYTPAYNTREHTCHYVSNWRAPQYQHQGATHFSGALRAYASAY
ncbi:hypothetical protein LZ32DRAFT_391476 [Colletotrichum eremochloae]|nr:hypothetical protein LZ32DRAFT_391476 [Colletotrichum eremochloae]